MNSDTHSHPFSSQSGASKNKDPLLDSLNTIVGDENLVFKLCFNQNRVEQHMRVKINQESLDTYIAKKVSHKEGLKQKAMRKNRELFNPKTIMES